MINKSKLMLPVLAAIVGVAASAFTVDFHAKDDITYFKYDGTTETGYTNANNWIMSTSEPDGCSRGDKTCVVSSNTFSTVQALVTYLQLPNSDPQVSDGQKYQIVDQHLPITQE